MQYRLATSAYIINQRYGAVDRSILNWVLPIMKRYKGSYANERLLRTLESHSDLRDEQLSALGNALKSDGSRALTVRKYDTPFLDSRIADLGLFSCEFQVSVLEFKAQLSLLNAQVDDAMAYRTMTFAPDISDENYAAVRHDLEETYSQIGDRSRTIADSVDRIISVSK